MDHSSLDWLSKSPDTWEENENYMQLLNFVCVNDPSERVVQLAEKRVKSVRSEAKFQDTLLTVHELQVLSKGLKRDRFKKSDLQKIVKKLMAT